MFLTYILFLAFLAIFGFTAIPVFLFFNMWTTCAAMRSPDANITSPDSICVDVRQYGESPALEDIEATMSFILSLLLCLYTPDLIKGDTLPLWSNWIRWAGAGLVGQVGLENQVYETTD